MNVSNGVLDVFVAGGGPAGLALAIAVRKHGLSVAVADPAMPPIDKACGEGIMPAGVSALRLLGVDITAQSCAPFRGIKFVDESGEASAEFPSAKAYGIRRTALHRALVSEAGRCGAELCWGSKVTALLPDGVVADGRKIEARYVVLADGQQSALRGKAGFGSGKVLSQRYGFRQHYRITPWSEFVEVHWSDVGQMYVTPVSQGEVGIALLTREKGLRFEEALVHFPAVASRLVGREPSSRLMGSLTTSRRVSSVVRNNIALLGDASGSADAITGDGLSLAFCEALVLARAIGSGDLASYQREHARILRRPLTMGRLLLLMDRRPGLRRMVVRAFRAKPALFDLLLKVHIGETLLVAPNEESRGIAA